MNYSRLARSDFWTGLKLWRLWTTRAWEDIRQRYRRSVIGPFWMAISSLVWIGSLGFVFSKLWKMEASGYIPYVAAGLVAWVLISTAITESCNIFVQNKSMIMSVKMPFSLYIYQSITKNVLVYFHSVLAYVIVCFIWPVEYTLSSLLFFPNLLLLILNITWIMAVFGVLGARYRDVEQIVISVTQVTMLITPIFWQRSMLRNHPYIVDFNPLYHFIELLRAPMLGHAPDNLTYLVVFVMACTGWLVAYLVFRSHLGKIYYWL